MDGSLAELPGLGRGFGPGTALLLVDPQRDFVDDNRGALPVPGAAALLPLWNQLAAAAAGAGALVVATADWHPPDHVSFHTTHPGRRPGQASAQLVSVSVSGRQVEVRLFPPHCVGGTPGAQFAEGLDVSHVCHKVLKGTAPKLECLSAFHDIGAHSTGLAEWLREQQVYALYVCGVATDHCVRASVLDGLQAGFQVALLTDAVAGMNAAACKAALHEVRSAGAALMHSRELLRPRGGAALAGSAAGREQHAPSTESDAAGQPRQADVHTGAGTAAPPASADHNGLLGYCEKQRQAYPSVACSARPARQPAAETGEE